MIVNSFDVETTGLNPYNPNTKMFSYCIGDEQGNVEVYRVDNYSERKNKQNYGTLYDFFNDTSIIKVAHNYKYELSILMLDKNIPNTIKDIIENKTIWHDTLLQSQLLRNLAPSHALDALCWELCGYSRELDVRVKRAAKAYGGYNKVPEDLMTKYQIADGERCMLLFQTFFEDIKSDTKLYEDYLNEIELVKTTRRFEVHGLKLHVKKANKLYDWLQTEIEKINTEVYTMYGAFINLKSGPQIERLLFDELKLPRIGKTKKGNTKTDKDVLFELQHKYNEPILDLIIKYRSYCNGLSMIDSYFEHADKNNIIHPIINTNPAKTGRESSSNPNLQNVPKEEVLKNPFPVPARRCFRTRKGYTLYFADYAGQEIRLIVEVSQDKEMMDILYNGGDIHSEASLEWYGDIFRNETDKGKRKTKRGAGKNTTFAKAYGGGLEKLALTLGVDIRQARKGDNRFTLRFPNVASFSRDMAQQVKDNGYVLTPFGRRLYIPADKAYIGANYNIQGTGAGMLKRAQNKVDKYFMDKWSYDIRLVLPIHDEIIFSVPNELVKYEEDILNGVREQMIHIKYITVPLEVEFKKTKLTWDKAQEVLLNVC